MQQASEVGFTAQEALSHKQQVVISLTSTSREEQLLANPINPTRVNHAGIFCNCLAETLSEKRVSACPVENPFEQLRSKLLIWPQPLRQRRGFPFSEIIEFNPLPN